MPVFRTDSTIGRTVRRMTTTRTFRAVGPKVVPPIDRALSKLSGGRLMVSRFLVPSLVLISTGSKSGLTRRTPLACVPADGGWYVVGSNFGREKHPAWTGNLIANPDVEVDAGRGTQRVVAHLLSTDEKSERWPQLVEAWPAYDDYLEVSGRDLRVFHLRPADATGA